VIRILVLRALVLDVQGDRAAALTTLARALALAEPAGYVRLFIDEGPAVSGLLRAARGRARTPGYVDTLLAATPGLAESNRAHPAVSTDRPGPTQHGSFATQPGTRSPTSDLTTPFVEPLSSREREVLRLLVTGSSNRDIARTLVIAVSTVKSHLHSTFGKLGVRTRTQAIARARELGLL
jgi:LuxR family maltose regulon positive regulatory protein